MLRFHQKVKKLSFTSELLELGFSKDHHLSSLMIVGLNFLYKRMGGKIRAIFLLLSRDTQVPLPAVKMLVLYWK